MIIKMITGRNYNKGLFTWWAKYYERYPYLTEVVRDYFNIFPILTLMERVFGFCRDIIYKK